MLLSGRKCLLCGIVVHRDVVQAIDQRLKHLLRVIKLSRDLQIDAVRETIEMLAGVRQVAISAEEIK